MNEPAEAGAAPQIPPAWQTLPLSRWQQPLVLLGAPDTGKSTLGKWLHGRLLSQQRPVAYLDLDPGQNDLGPPSTLALGLSNPPETQFPPSGQRWLYFLGSNSPRGHLLRQLSGLALLLRLASQQANAMLLVNTCGFVTAQQGGQAMKWAIIELLRPCSVIGLQRSEELEPLLRPLRRLPGVEVVDLPVAPAVRRRDLGLRQQLRSQRYRAYFQAAQRRSLSYRDFPVFPQPRFGPNQLVALEDAQGMTIALAVVEKVQPQRQLVDLYAPWAGTETVSALRLGRLQLDLERGIDRPLPDA